MGPKIAVIGSCQVVGISETLKKVISNSQVSFWHLGVYPTHTREELAAMLPEYDLVVSQITEHVGQGILDPEILRASHKNFIYLPPFTFRGFQPDCVYIVDHEKNAIINGPYGHFHSSLIAASYVLDLPEARVARLFNALAYAKFGYFDAFPAAVQHLKETYADAGFDLKDCPEKWIEAAGAFTYLPNHPKIFVLEQLAIMTAQRSGFETTDLPADEKTNDMLWENMHFPIFPEIAKRHGLKGSTIFTRPLLMAEDNGEREDPLEVFIAKSYEIYRKHPKEILRHAVPQNVMTGLEALLLDRPDTYERL